jgi:hypothetical protein
LADRLHARRLATALGMSLLMHAWLLHSHYGKGAARGGEDTVLAPSAARLTPVAAPLTAAAINAASVDAHVPAAPVTMPAEIAPAAIATVAQTRELSATIAATHTATASSPAPSQPSDPTYYAAGDLDVFPRALVKPDLNAALSATREPGAGKVRATVLIDEAGVVNAVRGVEAAAQDIEAVARELLLRTRFTPARDKEGRIVKAQVLVALEYDTRDTRAAQTGR